jgi:beta-N-acetylhexosaminidase
VTRLHYRLGSTTPGNQVLGAADDPAATARVAGFIAGQLRRASIRWNLAPVADVNSDPLNPVIGVRSFGDDPQLVSRHTSAWVAGCQGLGVAACAKHFPGHGDTQTDSHLALPTVNRTERVWRQSHLPPFAAAIEAGVQSIMTAHLRLPAVDPDQPATLSRRILHDLLRTELGFTGVVVTDALEMAAISATVGITAGAVAALAAGADALCIGARGGQERYLRVRDAICAAVRDGELPLARLEEASARVELLREWTAQEQPAVVSEDSRMAQALALTRQTVRIRGPVVLTGRPVVIELRSAPNLAVGAAGWDLSGPLGEYGLLPVLTTQVQNPGPDLDALLGKYPRRPLVVVGRDVARQPRQRAVWSTAHAAAERSGQQLILIDLGLPRTRELDQLIGNPGHQAAYVLVGGAARPNLRVAAEVLRGTRPGRGTPETQGETKDA